MKKLKIALLTIISILLLSGCVKNSTSMTINKDKSMDLEVELLVSTIYSDELSSKIDTKKYENDGYKVTNVNLSDDGNTPNYSGIKLKKTFKNIDDYSGSSVNRVDLKEVILNNKEGLFFVREKCFLKDTYTANFMIKLSEEDNIIEKKEPEVVENNTLTTESEFESSLDEEEEIVDLSGEMEYKIIVNLPYSSSDSNADDKSDLNRVHTWNLKSDGSVKNIDYTFNVYNITNIILFVSGCLVVIIGVIVAFIIIKKKRSSREMLIHTDYDESIANEI